MAQELLTPYRNNIEPTRISSHALPEKRRLFWTFGPPTKRGEDDPLLHPAYFIGIIVTPPPLHLQTTSTDARRPYAPPGTDPAKHRQYAGTGRAPGRAST